MGTEREVAHVQRLVLTSEQGEWGEASDPGFCPKAKMVKNSTPSGKMETDTSSQHSPNNTWCTSSSKTGLVSSMSRVFVLHTDLMIEMKGLETHLLLFTFCFFLNSIFFSSMIQHWPWSSSVLLLFSKHLAPHKTCTRKFLRILHCFVSKCEMNGRCSLIFLALFS